MEDVKEKANYHAWMSLMDDLLLTPTPTFSAYQQWKPLAYKVAQKISTIRYNKWVLRDSRITTFFNQPEAEAVMLNLRKCYQKMWDREGAEELKPFIDSMLSEPVLAWAISHWLETEKALRPKLVAIQKEYSEKRNWLLVDCSGGRFETPESVEVDKTIQRLQEKISIVRRMDTTADRRNAQIVSKKVAQIDADVSDDESPEPYQGWNKEIEELHRQVSVLAQKEKEVSTPGKIVGSLRAASFSAPPRPPASPAVLTQVLHVIDEEDAAAEKKKLLRQQQEQEAREQYREEAARFAELERVKLRRLANEKQQKQEQESVSSVEYNYN